MAGRNCYKELRLSFNPADLWLFFLALQQHHKASGFASHRLAVVNQTSDTLAGTGFFLLPTQRSRKTSAYMCPQVSRAQRQTQNTCGNEGGFAAGGFVDA